MKIDKVSSDKEDEVEDFQAFTTKLLTITNRGGLFCIKNGVYLFFLELEWENMAIFTKSVIKKAQISKKSLQKSCVMMKSSSSGASFLHSSKTKFVLVNYYN